MEEKPPLLFKPDLEYVKFTLHTKMFFDEDLEDLELTEPAILVHSPLRIMPCSEFERIPFYDEVKSALRSLEYTSVYNIQRYCWRTVLRGDHVMVISSQGTGKTLGYAPCVCNFVLSPYPNLPEGKGPIVIILCPTVKLVDKVYTLIQNIMIENTEIHIQKLVHIYDDVLYEIQTSIDILITIPILLIRLLNNKIIDLHRVCHVVLDETSDMYKREEEINWLLYTFQEELESRPVYMPIQLIISSQTWTQPIEDLALSLKLPPFICIASYLEAAIYGDAEINIRMIDAHSKDRKLISLIRYTFNIRRTLIIYNDADDPSRLLKYLEVFGITYIHRKETTLELVSSHKRCWYNATPGNRYVLVLSDEMLKIGPPIHSAEIIIQYSLPETWSKFDFRFSGLLNKYSSPLVPKSEDEQPCVMEILVDMQNRHLIPKLINFAQRSGAKVSDKLLDYNKTVTLALEIDKLNAYRPICMELLSMGSCNNNINCQLRHILCPTRDRAPLLPKYGLMKYKLVNVQNPGQYYIRLIEWTDRTGKKYDLDIRHVVKAMIADADKVPPLSIDIGSLYLLRIDETFQRCKVVNIVKKDGFESIFVHSIDTGLHYKVSSSQLYTLNEDLHEMPHQAVLIYIANIKPRERQVTWPSPCLDILNSEFEKAGYLQSNYYCTSRILLQVGDVLLVDDVKLIEKEDDETLVKRMSVCDTLKKMDCVDNHPDHLDNLYKLCQKYDVQLENYNLPVEEDNYVLPVDEENDEEYDSLPFEEENEEEDDRLPVEEDNYSSPNEKENEEENCRLPVKEENCSLPNEEENYRLSVEEENDSLPNKEENYRLPVEEENYSLPVKEENHGLLGEEQLPIIEEEDEEKYYSSSVEEENSSSPVEEDSDSSFNFECLSLLHRHRY